jgi:hypothetical protein
MPLLDCDWPTRFPQGPYRASGLVLWLKMGLMTRPPTEAAYSFLG